MIMWISWHKFQLQVTRMLTELIVLFLLASMVPYTLGKNYYLVHANATRDVVLYIVLSYITALIVPWLIALIDFLISNHRYHRDTNNSWWALLKQRKLSFLKIGLFFERVVMFVLTLISMGLSEKIVLHSAGTFMDVLYVCFATWMVIFCMLTFYRYLLHEAQRRMLKEESQTDDKKD